MFHGRENNSKLLSGEPEILIRGSLNGVSLYGVTCIWRMKTSRVCSQISLVCSKNFMCISWPTISHFLRFRLIIRVFTTNYLMYRFQIYGKTPPLLRILQTFTLWLQKPFEENPIITLKKKRFPIFLKLLNLFLFLK